MASIFSKTYMQDVFAETKAALDEATEGGSMNKGEVRRIIEGTLSRGNATPALFDLTQIMGVKAKLEVCTSISEVLRVLNENRSLISKSFGLSDLMFDEGVACLSALRAAA